MGELGFLLPAPTTPTAAACLRVMSGGTAGAGRRDVCKGNGEQEQIQWGCADGDGDADAGGALTAAVASGLAGGIECG